ncbi:MAG: hypothetical protein Q8928_12275 [Bacteroidota bacterium]|nr:hypothetical protein [Bacteroidota bacterium]
MKADSSTLVYIIISVVLLVVSAFNKNKKKTSSDEQGGGLPENIPRANPWEKELEDIFGKVLGQEPEPVPKREFVPEPVTQSEALKNEPPRLKQPQTVVPHSSSSFIYNDEEPEERRIELSGQEFEKAVIYAEILNRKYF